MKKGENGLYSGAATGYTVVTGTGNWQQKYSNITTERIIMVQDWHNQGYGLVCIVEFIWYHIRNQNKSTKITVMHII